MSPKIILSKLQTYVVNNLINMSQYVRGKRLWSVSIPETVKSIGDHAFESCGQLKNIKLPSNLKKIEYRTFASCSSLTSIDIPSKVESIDKEAFASCENLKSIIIPKNVTKISNVAFDCSYKLSVFMEHESQPRSLWVWDHFPKHTPDIYWDNMWHYDENGNPVPNE